MSDVVSSAASGAAAGSWAGPIGAVAGGIIGAAGSYLSGQSSARYAERSYKHRYRWMVNDLKKAGLNPMLAVSQGPGSPPQPDFPNVGEAAVEGAATGAQAASAAQLLREQTNLLEAQGRQAREGARKTELEADYQQVVNNNSARRLGLEMDLLDAQLEKVTKETQQVIANTKGQNIANLREEQLAPLLVAYQKTMNQARQLGLSRDQAEAKFFDTVGAAAPMAPTILRLLEIILRNRRD